MGKIDLSQRRRGSGSVVTWQGNLKSPRDGDYGALMAMLVIYPAGFVRIKLGIRLRSRRGDPRDVRIDISTRASVFGLCGGEHILHSFPDNGIG